MGTRSLIFVLLNGEYKVAQYSQWDGNPDGQGATVLKFLQNMDKDSFIEKLKNCKFITNSALGKLWKDVGTENGLATLENTIAFKKLYPQLHRDAGADVLNYIQNSEGELLLSDDQDFAYDSLFCEWAYVVNLDEDTLEVYDGFNKTQPATTARFKGDINEGGYYPIILRMVFALDNLPTEEDFINAFITDEDLREDLQDEIVVILDSLKQRSEYNKTANIIADFVESSMDSIINSVYPEG